MDLCIIDCKAVKPVISSSTKKSFSANSCSPIQLRVRAKLTERKRVCVCDRERETASEAYLKFAMQSTVLAPCLPAHCTFQLVGSNRYSLPETGASEERRALSRRQADRKDHVDRRSRCWNSFHCETPSRSQVSSGPQFFECRQQANTEAEL